jgi:hypothetical protein
MDLDKVLQERHCTRKFIKKDVSFHKIISIIEAASLAPAAGNINAVRIVIVNDDKIKEQLVDAAAGQQFLAEVPYVLAVCSDTEQTVRSYGKRADIYLRQQAGAAIENMFLKTIDLGLDTCWVGAFDDATLRRLLKIPDSFNIEALMPIGYSAEKKLKKHAERRKFDIKHMVFYNKLELFSLKRKIEKGVEKFEV